MKKILAITLLTWFVSVSTVFAYGYPRFWKGDKNFPLIFGKQGIAWYLDKKSITVKVNDPPYYIITGKIFYIGDSDYSPDNELYSNDKEISGTEDYEFFFDEEEFDMRVGDYSIKNWRYLKPSGMYFESGRPMAVGEAVFYVSQGRKFYGNFLWKDLSSINADYRNDKVAYFDIYSDDFYKDLR